MRTWYYWLYIYPVLNGVIVLNELYYLENFKLVLESVRERNSQALNNSDKQFIRLFFAAPQAAQALLVRLIMRKGELFSYAKLSYAEIPDFSAALEFLADLGWVRLKTQLRLDEAFALFTLAELKLLLPQWPKASSEIKEQWLSRILASEPDLLVQVQKVVELRVSDHSQRFRLLFFGNLKQNWSEFVTEQLGLYKYEAVDLNAEAALFGSPAELDSYMALESLYSDIEQTLLAYDAVDLKLALVQLGQFQAIAMYDSPWLSRRRDKLLFRLGRTAERRQQFSLAEQLYGRCNWEESRQRLVRVYELQGKTTQAVELAATALAEPQNEAERQQVLRMWPRLYKRFMQQRSTVSTDAVNTPQFHQVNGLLQSSRFSTKNIHALSLVLPVAVPARVEHRSAKSLSGYAEQCFFVENCLINGLFGLLFWDVLFAPVPGAFFHPFQTRPADLYETDFQKRRAHLFEQRFRSLETSEYQQIIRKNYVRKQGIQSSFVHWGVLSDGLISHALRCISASELRLYFTRLLATPKNNGNGMPDLIIFDLLSNRYRWVEIKAPGDKLQDNQVRWFEFFATHNIEAAVCYVQWADHEG
ncbi:VRR-NUC domain-containing protein [Paenalcaligenes niemegkensis]|uniref:VRR-NUC domain-containing protein n=1 Tax=Paenalcaligenes niemegkensis TaxID=2895469 RepID=UPI001EE85579|nr:VRR-NUC domain-containing protein [Paenalcaligenes niemegkensis]MCQ9616514.1 VRR-NUC domain-containing protein [Paenalcaligenes niemegkensis]